MPSDSGGCASEYAIAAHKALQNEIAEVAKESVELYLLGSGTLNFKSFEQALVSDFGERFRPHAYGLWIDASKRYEALRESSAFSDLPPLVRKPQDYIPDYHSLDNLSDEGATAQAIANLVQLAKDNKLTPLRGGYEVKGVEKTQAAAEKIISDPALLAQISKAHAIQLDDLTRGLELMMDGLVYEQRVQNVLVEAKQAELDSLNERAKSVPGSVSASEIAAVDAELQELILQSMSVADLSTAYTGLASGNATQLGRAMRILREKAQLRRAGIQGEAWAAIYGVANKQQPPPSPGDPATVERFDKVTLSGSTELVAKKKAERADRLEKLNNKAEIRLTDIFGDVMPEAKVTKPEVALNSKIMQKALKGTGEAVGLVSKADKALLERMAQTAKLVKANYGRKEGAC